jgi:dipeptidyl aminopeptidase/acylaminoacyl peptidase
MKNSHSHVARMLLVLALLLAPAVVAAQHADGITPLQISTIESVTSVTLSPDGRQAVYTLSVPADPLAENAPNTTELHVLDVASGASTPLYTEGGISGVTLRPMHGTVTFIARIGEATTRGIYELALDGGEPAHLVAHGTNIIGYQWSPDGNSVAYMANEPVTAPATPLPYAPTIYEEGQPQRRAYVLDVVAGELREILEVGSYYILSWSPAGDRLAVSVAPSPVVDDMYMAQAVKVVDPASGAVAAEIDNQGKIDEIVWSPDGTRLALLAGTDINDPIAGRIMVVSASGGQPVNIYEGFEGKFEQIQWTADDAIYFIASQRTDKLFGTIRPDGSGFRPIVRPGMANLLSFSRGDAGAVAFVANTPNHPSEVYTFSADQDLLQRMTMHNAWLADIPMGEQRVVTYPARDGEFDIDGILITPVGYEEGKRVPLITVVHGGPEAHYSNGWLTAYQVPGQLAAGRGYAVFYPNYRGSTGRGLDFIRSSQADLAGKEFDDIVDGVDYLIGQGIVDGERVGVTGGSYGGYATAWMSTYYSDRFAAGVMFVGISNNISKWGTSDIPNELYLVHSRERMWENNWMKYLQNSPIYHVDRSQTPLLIMHGAEDTRVHPAQSLELYRHLKVRQPDVPVRLVFYPGEGHGNARAASRLDYTLRMIGWFDSYLMGDGEMPSRDIELPATGVSAVPAGN